MQGNVRAVTRAAMIAAIYAVLTVLLQPISYGSVQFRISEAMTILPLFTPDAIPGLWIGCVLANLLGGAMWFDVVFGSLTTLLAAVLSYRFRRHTAAALSWPVILNGLIVGPIVYFSYDYVPGGRIVPALLAKEVVSVAFGEAVVCYLLGYLLLRSLQKASAELWH